MVAGRAADLAGAGLGDCSFPGSLTADCGGGCGGGGAVRAGGAAGPAVVARPWWAASVRVVWGLWVVACGRFGAVVVISSGVL